MDFYSMIFAERKVDIPNDLKSKGIFWGTMKTLLGYYENSSRVL